MLRRLDYTPADQSKPPLQSHAPIPQIGCTLSDGLLFAKPVTTRLTLTHRDGLLVSNGATTSHSDYLCILAARAMWRRRLLRRSVRVPRHPCGLDCRLSDHGSSTSANRRRRPLRVPAPPIAAHLEPLVFRTMLSGHFRMESGSHTRSVARPGIRWSPCGTDRAVVSTMVPPTCRRDIT